MSKKPFFTGPFAPICESYVAQKRASGLDYNQQAKLLRLFDNFCKDHEIQKFEGHSHRVREIRVA